MHVCTIAAVTKKSLVTCKGAARSSTETPMWLLPVEGEEEDARQARKHVLRYGLFKEENKEIWTKGTNNRKKENHVQREEWDRQSRTEIQNKPRNVFSLCC